MRRAFRFALLLSMTAGVALAEGSEGDSNLLLWKWANFILLAIGLGYLMAKMLPPMFAARSADINKDIEESRKTREQAEARLADVERRLSSLDAEMASIRAQSQKETTDETERLAKHSAEEIEKIKAQATREIADAAQVARIELKRYAAKLAIDLAEQKIRGRMTPAVDDRLVRGFMRNLK